MTLGIAHARRSMALLRKCNEVSMRSKHLSHFTSHHVFSHAGNAGNECSFSRHERPCVRFQRSIVFAGKAFFCVQHLFENPHCSQIDEVLHCGFTHMQLGSFFSSSSCFFLVSSPWVLLNSLPRRVCVLGLMADNQPHLGVCIHAPPVLA